jgi:hypothetical protein
LARIYAVAVPGNLDARHRAPINEARPHRRRMPLPFDLALR